MDILKSYLKKIQKRKYISLNQTIVFQYIFMFAINIRPYPVFEQFEVMTNPILVLLYLLTLEITYYVLNLYSLVKVVRIRGNKRKKITASILIIPNLIFT